MGSGTPCFSVNPPDGVGRKWPCPRTGHFSRGHCTSNEWLVNSFDPVRKRAACKSARLYFESISDEFGNVISKLNKFILQLLPFIAHLTFPEHYLEDDHVFPHFFFMQMKSKSLCYFTWRERNAIRPAGNGHFNGFWFVVFSLTQQPKVKVRFRSTRLRSCTSLKWIRATAGRAFDGTPDSKKVSCPLPTFNAPSTTPAK